MTNTIAFAISVFLYPLTGLLLTIYLIWFLSKRKSFKDFQLIGLFEFALKTWFVGVFIQALLAIYQDIIELFFWTALPYDFYFLIGYSISVITIYRFTKYQKAFKISLALLVSIFFIYTLRDPIFDILSSTEISQISARQIIPYVFFIIAIFFFKIPDQAIDYHGQDKILDDLS